MRAPVAVADPHAATRIVERRHVAAEMIAIDLSEAQAAWLRTRDARALRRALVAVLGGSTEPVLSSAGGGGLTDRIRGTLAGHAQGGSALRGN